MLPAGNHKSDNWGFINVVNPFVRGILREPAQAEMGLRISHRARVLLHGGHRGDSSRSREACTGPKVKGQGLRWGSRIKGYK